MLLQELIKVWNGGRAMLDARMESLLMICEKNSFTKAAEALSLT